QVEPEVKPIHEFTHNGQKYSVINHLLNAQSQDFISLMALEKDNEKHPWRGLAKKIAILAKKEGETLDDYDIQERSNQFLDLSITIAKSLDSFFLLAQTIFSKDFHTSMLKSQN